MAGILYMLLLGAIAILVAAFADPDVGLTALNLHLFLICGLLVLTLGWVLLLPEPIFAVLVFVETLANVWRWLPGCSKQADISQ